MALYRSYLCGRPSSGTFRNLSCDVDYAESGTFESAVYDAGRTVTWEEISWTETLPTNTDVEFQIAVSSSAEGPWSYVGPDGTAGTKFSTASGQSVGMSVSGRYMKTKAFLTGDGTVTPTVSEVHVSHDGDVTSQFSSFVYDDAGNMTEKAVVTDSSSVVETRTYNNMNELTANSVDDGTTVVNWTFSYDSNGNLISRSDGTDTWDYTWDDENRLIEVEFNSTTQASYEYDFNSRLIQRVAGGTTTNYTWDNWDLVKDEKTGAITETTRYAVPEGRVRSFDRNGSRFYLHGDGLSNSQLVTNSAGVQAARIIYGAWGEELHSSDSIPNGLDARFVGGLGIRKDADTGLIYMRRRWYSPQLQRFISRDPIGLAGGSNTYLYPVNPLVYVDPEGLKCLAPGNAARNTKAAYEILKAIYEAGLRNPKVLHASRLSAVSPQTRLAFLGFVVVGGSGTLFIDKYVPEIFAATDQPKFPLPGGGEGTAEELLEALRKQNDQPCSEDDPFGCKALRTEAYKRLNQAEIMGSKAWKDGKALIDQTYRNCVINKGASGYEVLTGYW